MEIEMRALSLSLVLAFTMICSTVSIAGSSGTVPHAGLFAVTIQN